MWWVLASGVAVADDLTVCDVGCTHTELSVALTDAVSGDVVHIGAGTWTGAFNIDASITLINDDAPAEAVLVGVDEDDYVIEVANSVSVTLKDLTIGGDVSAGPNVLIQPGARLEIIGGVIRNGVSGVGAGVTVGYVADLILQDVDVIGNFATDYGGGVKCHGSGTVTVTGGRFADNGSQYGGGLALDDCDASFDGTVFEGNFALGGDGGGIYAYLAEISLIDTSFTGGDANAGGGVYAAHFSSLDLQRVDFEDNQAIVGSGGALSLTQSMLAVTGGSYVDNHAAIDGGAIQTAQMSFFDIDGAWFEANSAGLHGGAVWPKETTGVDGSIVDTTFLDNSAGDTAGAFAWNGTKNDGAKLILDRVTVAGNEANFYGAFYANEVDDLTLTDVLVEGNETFGSGAALAVINSGTVIGRRIKVCDNLGVIGGGLYVSARDLADVSNLIVGGNAATYGSGAWFQGSGPVRISHAAFVDNGGLGDSSGAIVSQAVDVAIDTSIIAYHEGSAVQNEGVLATSFVDFWNNGLDGVSPGGTDLAVDPLFVSLLAGSDCGRDLHLQPSSPLIDAGPTVPAELDGSAQDIGPYGGVDAWLPDQDGDGVPTDLDCDDLDPTVFPGADELCNGEDEDCDGVVDEDAIDAPAWTDDSDGDGYGYGPVRVVSCEEVEGAAPVDGDCDDADASIHPGADEVCDDIDSDCDGLLTDPEALDALTRWTDVDGDGFGVGTAVRICEEEDGLADTDGDCDDANPDVFPGALETWYDGRDQNCDGASDFDADLDAFDSDQFGGTDCNDDRGDVHPEADDLVGDNLDQDCDGAAAAAAMFGGGCGCNGGGGAPIGLGVLALAFLRRRRA